MTPPETPGASAVLRYGDVVQFGVRQPDTDEIAWGLLGVVFSGNDGTIQTFPVHQTPTGEAHLTDPQPVAPTSDIRRFGRLTLLQVRTAAAAIITDPDERMAIARTYARDSFYTSQTTPVESTLHDETTPYLPEMRAEIDATLQDMEEMNRRLVAAGRPDLVMTQRVDILPVNTPEDLINLTNFMFRLEHFGFAPENAEETFFLDFDVMKRWDNIQPPTDEQYGRLASVAGLETDIYMESGFGNGADGLGGFTAEQIEKLTMTTHIDRECFARMMTIFPAFTKRILQDCVGNHPQDRPDDVFIAAYQVMARLIDGHDAYVAHVNPDDSITGVDPSYLIH